MPCVPLQEISAAYNVLSGDGIALRGLFIIDKDGLVQVRCSSSISFSSSRRLDAMHVLAHPPSWQAVQAAPAAQPASVVPPSGRM